LRVTCALTCLSVGVEMALYIAGPRLQVKLVFHTVPVSGLTRNSHCRWSCKTLVTRHPSKQSGGGRCCECWWLRSAVGVPCSKVSSR
jgi:hypothetical protein